ncbi:hypothetical protein OPQ81_008337 [Rhizoctonia solani]|nr:hypothetical protein OPQ81_008337 [Rhizoctonia solani]
MHRELGLKFHIGKGKELAVAGYVDVWDAHTPTNGLGRRSIWNEIESDLSIGLNSYQPHLWHTRSHPKSNKDIRLRVPLQSCDNPVT